MTTNMTKHDKKMRKWTSLRERLIWTAPSGQRDAKRREIKLKTIKMESKENEKGAKWKQNLSKGTKRARKMGIVAGTFDLDRPIGAKGCKTLRNKAKNNQNEIKRR